MEIDDTLLYWATIFFGAFGLITNIFIRKKNLQVTFQGVKSNSFTVFLIFAMVLNIFDFIFSYYYWDFEYNIGVFILYEFSRVLWTMFYFVLIWVGRDFSEKKGISKSIFVFAAFSAIIVGLDCCGYIWINDIFAISQTWIEQIINGALRGFALIISSCYIISLFKKNKKIEGATLVCYTIALGLIFLSDIILDIGALKNMYIDFIDLISYIPCWIALGIWNISLIWKSYDGKGSITAEKNSDEYNERFAGFAQKYMLSDREIEMAKSIYEGKSVTDTAVELGLSENTVRVHNYRLYKKLLVEDRVQAANLIRSEL